MYAEQMTLEKHSTDDENYVEFENDAIPSDDETDDNEDNNTSKSFTFKSKSFAAYQEIVNTKHQRNHGMLKSSGLLAVKKAIAPTSVTTIVNAVATRARGLKRTTTNIIRRHQPKHRKIDADLIIVLSGEKTHNNLCLVCNNVGDLNC